MNRVIFKILSLLFLFLSSETSSQIIQIYSSGTRTITGTFKTSLPNGAESFYFKLSPANQYSAEQTYRKFIHSDGFYIPHNSFVSPRCQLDPWGGSNCGQLLEVQSSRTDTGLILRAMTDPWWEPAGSIALTVNGGITDSVLLFNGFIFQYRGMAIDPLNDSVIYAGWYFIDSSKNFYKSTNRGNTWTGLTNINPFNPWPAPILRVNPFNNSILIYALYNSIQRSTNGGLNFSQLSVGPGNTKEIIFDYNDSLIYFLTNTGLYKTDRNVDNWQTVSQIIFNTIKIDPYNSNIIYGGKGDGLFRSTDRGVTWSVYNNVFMPSMNVNGILKNPGMGDTLIVSTNKAVYKVNGQFPADTVSRSYFPLKVGNKWFYKYYTSMKPNPWQHVMKVASDTVINFKIYSRLHGWILPLSDYVRVDPLTGVLYAYSQGCPGNEKIIDSLSSQFGDSAGGCSSGVKILADTGVTNQFGIMADHKSFSESFLGDISRKYVSGFGLTHFSITERPPITEYYVLQGCVIDGVVFGDTLLTGVRQTGNNIPEKFNLYQNYPNPFNPSTKIRFDVPAIASDEVIELKIYDVLGVEVRTLLNQKLSPGNYELEFNGIDLASGIYFYKLSAGNFAEAKRMILIK